MPALQKRGPYYTVVGTHVSVYTATWLVHFFTPLTWLILTKSVAQLKEHIILTLEFRDLGNSKNGNDLQCIYTSYVVNDFVLYPTLAIILPLYYLLPKEWSKGDTLCHYLKMLFITIFSLLLCRSELLLSEKLGATNGLPEAMEWSISPTTQDSTPPPIYAHVITVLFYRDTYI